MGDMDDDMTLTLIVTHDSNPVPYKRTTQKQKFADTDYHRYLSWKRKVYDAFVKKHNAFPHMLLEKNTKYYVSVVAYYKDKTHGDTDNVAKGINDAIFQRPLSDKYVAGFYDFDYDKDNPRVEIVIKEAAPQRGVTEPTEYGTTELKGKK